MKLKLIPLLGIVLGVILIPSRSLAQLDSDSPLMRNANFYSDLFHRKFLDGLVDPLKRRPSNTRPSNASTITTLQSSGATMPRKLAQSAPPEQRRAVEQVFTQLLTVSYPKVEQQLGIPKNDLAGAIAAFLIGSYEAYHNQDVDAVQAKAVIAQVRTIIVTNPQIQQATPAQKREMYEQMAILGLYQIGVRAALKEKPNAQISARLQSAGKQYLETFLKTSVDRVSINAQGLMIQ